jgi:SAM-dependent methyltransferase
MHEGLRAELQFWQGVYKQYEGQDYAAIQAANLPTKMAHFPDYICLQGVGLDLGCGPTSIFEGSFLTEGENRLYAVDPLMDEYQKMYTPAKSTMAYSQCNDGDPLPFANGFFDHIFCINVIDHTKHHQQLLQEIRRVLKVHGVLFFMVNFDYVLNPPNHTKLWDWETVQEETGSHFFPEKHVVVWEYDNQRYSYWGKFVKPT